MLRVELTTQLWRIRTLITLAAVAAIPVASGLGTASYAGHRYGSQGGLYGASPFSALNHAMASMEFTATLFLPLAAALLASAIGSADRAWGILRYLYVQPVSRFRLLAGKLSAVAVATAAGTMVMLLAGLATGLALFGWHPFHIIGAPALGTSDAITRVLDASGYTLLCMLSIAAIAFALGLLLPHGAEALGASLAFVIAGTILNAQPSLHALAVILPMHYWNDWTGLFGSAGTVNLGGGILEQAVTIAVAIGASVLVLLRRDPAA